MKIDDPAVRKMLAESVEFQRLFERHQRFEQQLGELDRLNYLTPAQELERRTIQKQKLAGKDEMAALLRKAGA
jgi:uncharacterized protein YdcH (DUF465 family)